MAIQYVTETEMLQALRNIQKLPTLSVDNGAGQSCAYVKIGDKCLRLRMDAAYSPNLMTALGVITYNDEYRHSREVPLVSNNMMAYDALRRLDVMTEVEVDHALVTGSFQSLLLDVMLTMAYEVGSLLFLPLPEGCSDAVVRKMETAADQVFKRINTDDYPLVKGRFAGVKATTAKFSPIYQDFKAPPSRWNSDFDDRYTHRKLMEMHFTALMRCMILHNIKVFYQLSFRQSQLPGNDALRRFVQKMVKRSDRVNVGERHFRMVVGCPAAEEWDLWKYSRMIAGTALRAVNIHCDGDGTVRFAPDCILRKQTIPGPQIVLEPCAAILPHVTGNLGSIVPNVMHGVGVYDSGASTNDVTLVLYREGKTYRVNCSTSSFGGAQIERNMLFCLRRWVREERAGRGLDTEFDLQEMPALQLALRLEKERYYEMDMEDGLRSITFHLLSGEVYTQRYRIRELVNEALRLPYRAACEGVNATEKSFLERAKEFLDEAVRRFYIATGISGNFVFETLIVTGGTSNVKELREVIANSRHFKHLLAERASSDSVGRGLALTISDAELESFKKMLCNSPELVICERQAKELVSCELKDSFYKAADEVAVQCIDSGTECDLEKYSKKVAYELLNNREMVENIDAVLKAYADENAEELWKKARSKAGDCFLGCLPHLPERVQLPNDYSGDLVRTIVQETLKTVDVRSMMGKLSDGLFAVNKNYWDTWLNPFRNPLERHTKVVEDIESRKDAARRQPLDKRNFKAIRKALKDTELYDKQIAHAIDEAFRKADVNDQLRDEYIEKITAYLTMTHFDIDQTAKEI